MFKFKKFNTILNDWEYVDSDKITDVVGTNQEVFDAQRLKTNEDKIVENEQSLNDMQYKIGNLSELNTSQKDTLVNAVNDTAAQLAEKSQLTNKKVEVNGVANGPVGVFDNGTRPNYHEFSKSGHAVKGSIGALGNFEMNVSYNMDYKDGIHRYYDSSKNAWWFAMNNNGVYLQYAPSGYVDPGGAPDMWYNTGQQYGWRIEVGGHQTIGGGLTLGEEQTYWAHIENANTGANMVIRTPKSMLFNIDTNNDEALKQFIWGSDRKEATGGKTLMVLDENGVLSLYGNSSYSIIEQNSTNMSANLLIRSPKSMIFNIDTDNNETGRQFIWGSNRAEMAGGQTLMVLDEDGRLSIGGAPATSKLQVAGIPVYANNAAAITGGLTAGAFYRTGGDPDQLCVVH